VCMSGGARPARCRPPAGARCAALKKTKVVEAASPRTRAAHSLPRSEEWWYGRCEYALSHRPPPPHPALPR